MVHKSKLYKKRPTLRCCKYPSSFYVSFKACFVRIQREHILPPLPLSRKDHTLSTCLDVVHLSTQPWGLSPSISQWALPPPSLCNRYVLFQQAIISSTSPSSVNGTKVVSYHFAVINKAARNNNLVYNSWLWNNLTVGNGVIIDWCFPWWMKGTV